MHYLPEELSRFSLPASWQDVTGPMPSPANMGASPCGRLRLCSHRRESLAQKRRMPRAPIAAQREWLVRMLRMAITAQSTSNDTASVTPRQCGEAFCPLPDWAGGTSYQPGLFLFIRFSGKTVRLMRLRLKTDEVEGRITCSTSLELGNARKSTP